MQVVPYDLPEPFTIKEFAGAAKIHRDLAASVVPLLKEIGIVKWVGKRGREYLYETVETTEAASL